MAVGDKEDLDTDDLLKSLEGPPLKRRRLSPLDSDLELDVQRTTDEDFNGLQWGDSNDENEDSSDSLKGESESEESNSIIGDSGKNKVANVHPNIKEHELSLLDHLDSLAGNPLEETSCDSQMRIGSVNLFDLRPTPPPLHA